MSKPSYLIQGFFISLLDNGVSGFYNLTNYDKRQQNRPAATEAHMA